MTIDKIEAARLRLIKAREAAANAERILGKAVSSFLMMRPEGVRQLARDMGVSAPYVSDLIHGRRSVSDAMIARIKEIAQ